MADKKDNGLGGLTLNQALKSVSIRELKGLGPEERKAVLNAKLALGSGPIGLVAGRSPLGLAARLGVAAAKGASAPAQASAAERLTVDALTSILRGRKIRDKNKEIADKDQRERSTGGIVGEFVVPFTKAADHSGDKF